MIDWDDLPEPDYEEPVEPEGAYINGRWVDVEDLPATARTGGMMTVSVKPLRSTWSTPIERMMRAAGSFRPAACVTQGKKL